MSALVVDSFPFATKSASSATGGDAVALGSDTTRLHIYNAGPDPVYWSTKTGVTIANGWPLAAGAFMVPLDKTPGVDMSLYFVCDAAQTASVRILEEK